MHWPVFKWGLEYLAACTFDSQLEIASACALWEEHHLAGESLFAFKGITSQVEWKAKCLANKVPYCCSSVNQKYFLEKKQVFFW